MFLSDDAVAYELNVTIRFPESGKMRFSAVPVGILKSFFHIGIPDKLQGFVRCKPSGILEFIRYEFLSADIPAPENEIDGSGQRHALQRTVSLFCRPGSDRFL